MRKALAVAVFSVTTLAVSGCATVSSGNRASQSDASQAAATGAPRTVGEVIQQSDLPQTQPGNPVASASGDTAALAPVWRPDTRKINVGEIIIQGKRLKNTTFDIPVTINSRVEYWVDYFTGRGRPFFEKYLERAEFFVPYIQPILRQSGMPEDFVYLAMIESGFNNFARSHARAVGPWQFISATGKRYGLMVNWWVDERRDIRKSTLAAVEYLRELMGMFNSFELASAAYNAGEGKIARAVQRFGTKDFWAISRHRFLRPETRDYVPKIIAAALIAKNRTQFGFAASSGLRPNADEAVASDGELVKLIADDKDKGGDQSKAEGPHPSDEKVGDLLGNLSKTDLDAEEEDDDDSDSNTNTIVPATLMIPSEDALPEGQQVNAGSTNAPTETVQVAKPVPTPHLTKSGEVGGAELAEFDVKSPADLLKVARAAGLSYQTVKSLNPELLRWCTPPTVSSYRIRLPSTVKTVFLETYNHQAFPRQIDFMTYKVQRGETLVHVARHFGIKVDPIADLNGVSPRMPLKRGAKVLVPIPNDRSRSIASLEVRDPPEHIRHHRKRHYRKMSFREREAARIHARDG